MECSVNSRNQFLKLCETSRPNAIRISKLTGTPKPFSNRENNPPNYWWCPASSREYKARRGRKKLTSPRSCNGEGIAAEKDPILSPLAGLLKVNHETTSPTDQSLGYCRNI